MTDNIYPTGLLKTLITLSVMLVTIIEILDMTIVNVALPQMMGQLGASSDQITWVLTSYIVSSAIVMPLTGFLVARFGRRKLLLIDIVGFLAASILCGMSTSLSMMVIFRTLQGLFGASLVPMSQYILRDTYPPNEQGKAMAIWGFGVMVAPVLGPTLGGFITEWLNWRWVFFINIPVCIVAFMLTLQSISETATEHTKIDMTGLILMATGVGALQMFLDRGNSSDWFSSTFIMLMAFTALFCLLFFIVRGIHKSDNIINLSLFKNRNFSISTFMLTFYSMGVIGIISLQPLLLEHLLGYTAQTAGLAMAPRGLSAAVSMVLTGILLNRVDMRWLLLIGVIISDLGTFMMCSINLETSFSYLAWQGVVQGFGMGFFFVPISTLALSDLRPTQIAEASGLFSFGRSLGCSIGISILTTVITQESQINWNRLAGHLNAASFELKHWLAVQNLPLSSPTALIKLSGLVADQSSMIAFLDAFWLVAISFSLLIPCVFLLKKAKPMKGAAGMH